MNVINQYTSPCTAALFGTDTTYSVEADSITVGKFVTANSATLSGTNAFSSSTVGSTLYSTLKTDNNLAYLYGRYRIETLCDQECRDFRMGTLADALYKQMNDTYADLKVLVYVTAIGGALALFAMFVLVVVKSRAISQDYLYFYVYLLLVLLLITILLCIMMSDFKNVYKVNRNKLKTVGERCITDLRWKKVPTTLYNKTDMSSEKMWVDIFVTCCFIMVVVAIWQLYSISTALEEMNKPIGTWAVDENLVG